MADAEFHNASFDHATLRMFSRTFHKGIVRLTERPLWMRTTHCLLLIHRVVGRSGCGNVDGGGCWWTPWGMSLYNRVMMDHRALLGERTTPSVVGMLNKRGQFETE